jgi:hypothetical protein
MVQKMDVDSQLKGIGRIYYLKGRTMEDFIKFFKVRFPHHAHGHYLNEDYAETWANRFQSQTEWIYADDESRQVLMSVNKKKYGNDINAKNIPKI